MNFLSCIILLILGIQFCNAGGGSLTSEIQLHWNITSNNTIIEFSLQCQVDSWCGIGFGSSMTNTDMIIMIVEKEKVRISDKWGIGNQAPLNDTKEGGQENILQVKNWHYEKNFISANFTRKLHTNDTTYDKILKLNQTYDLIWAFSNNGGFTFHDGNYGHSKFTVSNNGGISSGGSGDAYKNHGLYMTIMWLGLIQVGIIAIRYFKWSMISQFVHFFAGITVGVITVWSLSHIYKKDSYSYDDLPKETRYHSRLGLTIGCLVLAQVAMGIMLKVKLVLGGEFAGMRMFRAVHKVLGYSICVPAFVNIRYGWHMYDGEHPTNHLPVIYTFYAIVGLVYLILEFYHRFSNKLKTLKFRLWEHSYRRVHSKKPGISQNLLDLENPSHIEVLEKILGGKKWVFLDHYILDISGFMQNHPGGAYMLQRSVGQDVGKYLNGCSSADFQVNPYYHSQPARNFINHLIIGRVAFAPVLTPRDSAGSMAKMPWNLVKKTEVAKSTYCFEFTSPSWEVVQDPPGFEWMGKHFRVKASVNGETVRRYYSLVLTDLEVWKSEVEGSTPEPSNTLKLYVKVYDQGKMTNHLLGLKNSVWLRGPVGAGLALESLPSGVCLAFGAGTGLLPFLDLVYSVWRGKAHSGFELHLYVTFRDYSDSFALDLLQATQKKHPNNLKLHLNIDKSDPSQKFSAQKLTEWTGGRPVHRAWTCGPSGFNMWIEGILRSQKLPSSIIYVL